MDYPDENVPLLPGDDDLGDDDPGHDNPRNTSRHLVETPSRVPESTEKENTSTLSLT